MKPCPHCLHASGTVADGRGSRCGLCDGTGEVSERTLSAYHKAMGTRPQSVRTPRPRSKKDTTRTPSRTLTRKITTCIGIDPGAQVGKNTGIAVWSRKVRTFTDLRTVSWWTAYDIIRGFDPETTLVVVEDPNLNRAIWMRLPETDEFFRRNLKTAEHVGRNKQAARLLIQRLRDLGFEVETVKPEGRKGTKRKKSGPEFKRLTKYKGSTSEHSRDAGMLVYDR